MLFVKCDVIIIIIADDGSKDVAGPTEGDF